MVLFYSLRYTKPNYCHGVFFVDPVAFFATKIKRSFMKYFLKNGCCEQVQFIPDSAETRFLLNALIFLPDEERIAKDVLKHFFSQFTCRGSDCLMNVFSLNSGKVNFDNC